MIVVGAVAGAYLLIRAFQKLPPNFANGLRLGLLWFAINCALDLVVLVGALDVGFGEWITGIGL